MRDPDKYSWADEMRDARPAHRYGAFGEPYGNNDGVSLTSTAHPRTPWYKRLWWHLWLRWRTPVLNPDTLEVIEININTPTRGSDDAQRTSGQ